MLLLFCLFVCLFVCFRVPATPDPSGRTVVLNTSDYGRIMKSTKFLTMEDRKQLEKEQKEQTMARMEASTNRKREMQEFEYLRRKNEKPSDIEQVSPCIEGSILEDDLF